jgi:hypothetical protein
MCSTINNVISENIEELLTMIIILKGLKIEEKKETDHASERKKEREREIDQEIVKENEKKR